MQGDFWAMCSFSEGLPEVPRYPASPQRVMEQSATVRESAEDPEVTKFDEIKQSGEAYQTTQGHKVPLLGKNEGSQGRFLTKVHQKIRRGRA